MPPHVQTVSELTGEIKDLIDGNLPEVWVCGEVSSCLRANSGHIYFTLKDAGAQLSAVVWRNTASKFRCEFQRADSLRDQLPHDDLVRAARGVDFDRTVDDHL